MSLSTKERDERLIDKNILNQLMNEINVKLESIKRFEIPVEYRPLLHPKKQTAQGLIEMFVEVLPMNLAKLIRPAKIEPRPPEQFELRLIIWETRGIFKDKKSPVDMYFKVLYDPEGWLSEDVSKETDTHFGASDGRGVFNWRMKFNLNVPCTFPRLSFAVLDFKLLKSEEAIGICYISLQRVMRRLLSKGSERIEDKWLPLVHPKDPGESKGEVKISIHLLPQFEADQNPVGEAQEEPNKDPRLERPTEGRGIFDFLKSIIDFGNWSFNFDFFGFIKVLGILAVILLILLVVFSMLKL